MDAKLAAYGAKQLVNMISTDPSINPELKRILKSLMAADMKTLKHESSTVDDAAEYLRDTHGLSAKCDVLSVVDGDGHRRFVVFV